MPATSFIDLTGNIYLDAVLGDEKWDVVRLTYSFPSQASYYGGSYAYGEASSGFTAFNTAQKATARAALKLYASVSNLKFSEISETSAQHADIRYARSSMPSTAWAYLPTEDAYGGDVWVGRNSIYTSPKKGNYAFITILHETGHALGLDHPHEGSPAMPASRDSIEYTVMSYRSYKGASVTQGYTNETYGFAQSLMMYDIAAIQHLYGANYRTNNTDTKYTWSPTTGELMINGVGQGAPGSNRIFQTVWDGGGTDTYDFSRYTTGVKVDLDPGAWTITSNAQRARLNASGTKLATGNIANALLYNDDPRSLIENAWGGSGADTIKGNTGANTLKGFAGSDKLYGRSGDDVLVGGSGNDKIYGQSGRDVMYGGDGADIFAFLYLGDSLTAARDSIRDFKHKQDHIDLRSIDANTLAGGNQAFTYIGKSAFTGTAGQLRFSGYELSADVNGDGVADFMVHMTGVTSLVKSDFYL